MNRALLSIAILAFVVALTGCPKPEGDSPPPAGAEIPAADPSAAQEPTFSEGVTEVDELAPDFTLLDTDGNEVSKDDFSGKILILDFWATWCTGCVKKLNEYKPIIADYGDKGVELVAVSLDTKPEVAAGGAKKEGFPYLIAMGNDEFNKTYLGEKIVIPQVRIIDRDGNLRYKFDSASTVADMELALSKLVDEMVGGDEAVTKDVLSEQETVEEPAAEPQAKPQEPKEGE